jgi:hypothetical protein
MGGKARRRNKTTLRIASVEFVPAPDIEKRLARIYDLLLRQDTEPHPRENASTSDNNAGAGCDSHE